MTNLPQWATKIAAAWVAVGTFLIVLANQSGIPVPDFLLNIFTQGFVDATVTVVSAVIVFYQFVRAIFAKTNTGEVLSLGKNAKAKYIFNPFKLTI